ncbi:MAG TPA: UDP-N-acetylmuramate--L-alanine ligase [Bacteroidales bacterium]|nr:UDP-N-acetylmuramate--L-alanine ligase [Bacteroidales bacterium]HRR48988.1 UDP-N-acetylmuramate--L-alanine ligase [Bacteroidales bacterium]HRT33490.1 UDP-N-acetylmuramate--L-alanine ligase [Bacteroidales bacterium]HRT83826.1 UDP-N-acetylmuramate--L-alanine ligase [Bacteroidales bacterium]
MNFVYLIGIGGIGMSALARYYNHAGAIVAGYDRTPSKLTSELEKEGIRIHYEDDIALIPPEFTSYKEKTLVIYTPAIPDNHSEYQYFLKNGYNIVKRSRALGNIASQKRCLAISGTHGKTTTSTLLAHILTQSGKGCTAFLGGISKNYHSNLLLDKRDYLVAEADEFDRSFLQLYPEMAVITSTDADHLDIYSTHNKIKEAFLEFASQVKPDGALIVKKGTDIDLSSVKAERVYEYSYDIPCDFYASSIKVLEDGFFNFDLNYPGGVIKNCTVGIPGWINIENSIAASSIALLEGISPEDLKNSLKTFAGVERRLDIRVKNEKCSYVDDYAHHPKELSSAISSLREIFAGRKITGIFQPHLYTRTRDFAEEFAKSLSLLDELILLDIYPAREEPIEGVTSEIIYKNVSLDSKIMLHKEELINYLAKIDIDVLVTFGAGDIDRFVNPITQLVSAKSKC